MTEISNLQQAQDFIKSVAKAGGNRDKIDTLTEKDILAKALANICDEKAYDAVKEAIASYEPYQPSKKTSNTKSTTNQNQPANNINNNRDHVSGQGNLSVGGNNNTINIHIGTQPSQNDARGSNTQTPETPNIPRDDNKVEPKPLSATEAREARADGKEVALALIGYTTDANQAAIRNTIRAAVNDRNVLEFLRGYTENSGGGNYFFEQMESEYGFDEAQNLMRKVGGHLQKYLENKYKIDSNQAREVAIILAESVLREEHAEKLDKIVNDELEK